MRGWSDHPQAAWARYGAAVASVLMSTGICWVLSQAISHEIAFMIFIPAVLAAARYGGTGPGLLALVAGGLIGDHFVLAPPGSVDDHGPVEMSILSAYCLSSILCMGLVVALRGQSAKAEDHARRLEREAAERRRAEEVAIRHNTTLTGINQILNAALSCQTEEALGKVCLKIAEEITQSGFGFIGEINGQGLHDIAISNPGWQSCKIEEPSGHRRPSGGFKIRGIYGRVLSDGRSLLTNDPANHPDAIGLPPGHPALTAFLGVPLIREGRTIGLIAVGNREGGYTQDQQEALEALAPAVVEGFMRKRAEEAANRAKLDWERTYDSVPDLIAVLDDQHRVVRANRAVAQRLGLTPEQCIGQSCYKVIHGLDAPPDFCPHAKLLADGKEHTAEVHEEKIQGDFLVSATPLYDEHGRVKGSIHVARDISELKRSADDLRRAKEQAEAANAAKDRFIAMLSHELRTPLTPALAAASMLAHDPSLSEAVREDLTMVARNIAMEARLIDDLLEITHIASGKLLLRQERTDVAEVLREAARICGPEAEGKSLRLAMQPPQAPCLMMADSTRLHQVFWNLLKNAIKFTPRGGTITVGCSTVVRENGTWLVVRISDSGMGIEADVLPRLFRPFEQGARVISDTFGGLGLGLSIAKAVVEMHGGRIQAESEGAGRGATFTVELPLATATPVARGGEDNGGDPAPADGKLLRILLVEDHADTARLIHRLLVAEGHTVTTAGDMATALAAAEKTEVDALVCDLGLPDGTGHDLMRTLLAKGKPIRGIAVSGYGSTSDLEKSRAAGFSEHLTKPIDFAVLRAALVRVAGEDERQ